MSCVDIGGGEIVLILGLLFILAVVAVGFLGLIYLIVRAVVNRPPPAPSGLPPEVVTQNQQRKDREHLKLLAIFHFVFAGLALVGRGLPWCPLPPSCTRSSRILRCGNRRARPCPQGFLDAFIWFYLFMGVVLLTGLVLNVLSGLFLWQKRNRVFSLVIGGLNCLQIPFGTALGVFTILVLSRDSVRQMYAGGTEST